MDTTAIDKQRFLLGTVLRKLRTENKTKTSELLQALGISKSQLYLIEKEQRSLKLPLLEKYADYFNVKVYEILYAAENGASLEAITSFREKIKKYNSATFLDTFSPSL